MIASAKIILDSFNRKGTRLTTFEIKCNRNIIQELNTHRVWSRNYSSSRAIPFSKMEKLILDESDTLPNLWLSNIPGMSGGEPLPPEDQAKANDIWLRAKKANLGFAKELADLNVHKQWVNRLTENWYTVTGIITATNFTNFFHQRCSPEAQPEIQALAEAMFQAYNTSKPKLLDDYEWHTPYILEEEYSQLSEEHRKLISAARCARVSYLNHDGTRDLEKDLNLFDRLVNSGHWSPLEHVATPRLKLEGCGNFQDYDQLRHEYIDEFITEFRGINEFGYEE